MRMTSKIDDCLICCARAETKVGTGVPEMTEMTYDPVLFFSDHLACLSKLYIHHALAENFVRHSYILS